jgi:nitroreductase
MEILEAIRKRRSIRTYQNKEVEPAKLNRVLEAARLAPSASNRQEWRFVVVQIKNTRELLMKAASNQKFVAQAPVVIVACADTDKHVMRCGQLCYPIDVAIAMDHMTLQAVEEGLGTCWIGAFDQAEVKRILNIPERIQIVSLLTLGYPAIAPTPSSRKKLEEIVMHEKWSQAN